MLLAWVSTSSRADRSLLWSRPRVEYALGFSVALLDPLPVYRYPSQRSQPPLEYAIISSSSPSVSKCKGPSARAMLCSRDERKIQDGPVPQGEPKYPTKPTEVTEFQQSYFIS